MVCILSLSSNALLIIIIIAVLSMLLILYCLDVLYTAGDFVALNIFAALGNEVRETCFTIETRVDTVLENTETITIVINVDREATPDNVVVRLTSTTILISEWNQPPELFVAYFLSFFMHIFSFLHVLSNE